MKCVLFPHDYYESAFEVDYKKLWDEGIRGLIFDTDNTLTGHGAPPEERTVFLVDKLKAIGFKVCILSNNREKRVSDFACALGVSYVFDAKKPLREGYLKALEIMGVTKDKAAFIGDQIYTDILGARLCDIRAILVKPLYKKEEIQIVIKRLLEKPVLWSYSFFKN